MAENVPNLRKDLDIQVYEANRSAQNFMPKLSPGLMIKLSEVKQTILKATKVFSHTSEPS